MVIREAKMHELAIAESIIEAVQTRIGIRPYVRCSCRWAVVGCVHRRLDVFL
jgi:hypothetical protein